jgi:hypothetical protein
MINMALFRNKKASVPEIQTNPLIQSNQSQNQPKQNHPFNEFPLQPANTNKQSPQQEIPKQKENFQTTFPQNNQNNFQQQTNHPTQMNIPQNNQNNFQQQTSNTTQPNFPQNNQKNYNFIQKIPEITKETSIQKQQNSQTSEEEPFFVRIDKFTQTKENFDNINMKVQEMEQIIKNLDRIKEEEEKELDLYKEEIEEMKKYLNEIDKEIFSKI